MSKTWKIIIAIVVVLVLGMILAKSQGWLPDRDQGLEVKVEEVSLQTVVQTVTASGKIQPETEVNISPEVSGEIIELPIVEGQQVKKGDLLVRINPDLYESAVNRSMASVNSAKAAKAQAEAQFIEAENIYKRNKKLHEQKVISDADYDASKRQYDVSRLSVESAKYQLRSAEATLKESRDNQRRTTIYAPTEGTISSLSVENGERVVGTAQMAGTELLRIANLELMEVVVEVSENDIVRVHKNDTAIVEIDAYLDEEFKGVVSEIASSANTQGTSADQITNFEVKIRILKSSYQHLIDERNSNPLRPGMTATVDIRTKVEKDVVAIPLPAVTTRTDTSSSAKSYRMKSRSTTPAEDESYEVVFVVGDNDKAQLQVVKTGIQDTENIVIVEGLEEGDRVITGPYTIVSKELKNQSRIKITEEEKADADSSEEEE
ncbi:MAG: efflux RND transporter periplasmic adaptor subunit [Schleiferiaceae bacterium]